LTLSPDGFSAPLEPGPVLSGLYVTLKSAKALGRAALKHMMFEARTDKTD
jgi:hypothetical protein